jgi:hypothetical protein
VKYEVVGWERLECPQVFGQSIASQAHLALRARAGDEFGGVSEIEGSGGLRAAAEREEDAEKEDVDGCMAGHC